MGHRNHLTLGRVTTCGIPAWLLGISVYNEGFCGQRTMDLWTKAYINHMCHTRVRFIPRLDHHTLLSFSSSLHLDSLSPSPPYSNPSVGAGTPSLAFKPTNIRSTLNIIHQYFHRLFCNSRRSSTLSTAHIPPIQQINSLTHDGYDQRMYVTLQFF